MLDIFVDADACPVKQEVYRVAERYGLTVFVVSNSWMRIPGPLDRVHSVVVPEGADAADDWIAERVGPGDVCITADIPLAARCLAAGAEALGPRGKPFSQDSIGEILATRELMSTLRDSGLVGGGPPAMTQKDRSAFLNHLDQVIQAVLRARPS